MRERSSAASQLASLARLACAVDFSTSSRNPSSIENAKCTASLLQGSPQFAQALVRTSAQLLERVDNVVNAVGQRRLQQRLPQALQTALLQVSTTKLPGCHCPPTRRISALMAEAYACHTNSENVRACAPASPWFPACEVCAKPAQERSDSRIHTPPAGNSAGIPGSSARSAPQFLPESSCTLSGTSQLCSARAELGEISPGAAMPFACRKTLSLSETWLRMRSRRAIEP